MKKFLASPQGQRFVVYYTLVHASWLNQVENFFSRLSRKYLKGRRYQSIEEFQAHLHAAIQMYNREAKFKGTRDQATSFKSVPQSLAEHLTGSLRFIWELEGARICATELRVS